MEFEWDNDKAKSNFRKHRLRKEYKRADFPGGLVRGEYAERLRRSSNVVVLKPKVAAGFPNKKAVNSTLLSLIEIARKTAYMK